MKPGARWRLEIPANEAPGGTTVWEVEVVRIVPPVDLPFVAPDPTKLTTTASGLKYEVLRPGTGKTPSATSRVTVHYAGWLDSGKLFDASYERGEPLTLGVGQVIKGWQEGLQLMQEGSMYRFVIPPEIGYGASGSPPTIPPNSTLVFQVELIKIE
jgi:FKBP-type peptidyl-prolyl cis-trans isomerase FkpA